MPFQFNGDSGYGPADGDKAYVNVQSVIPISLNADWNLISRTILLIAWKDDIAVRPGDQSGIGDVVQSLFLSPMAIEPNGIIWGLGPTRAVIRQSGDWTYGALVNHICSFAGDHSRADASKSKNPGFPIRRECYVRTCSNVAFHGTQHIL